MNMPWLIVLGALILIGAFLFNRLVRQRALVAEAWSGIDVQLKRRRDLIPNLVEAVKAYRDFERSTLEKITGMRALGINESDPEKRAGVEREVASGIKSVIAVAESYPDLKSNASFLALQNSLSGVEDDLQYARRYYNGTVRDLNVLINTFPSNLAAKAFGFHEAPFFEIEYATERSSPDVSFS